MGGEKAKLAGLEAGHEGSPPRGQGKGFHNDIGLAVKGITPA